MDFHKVIHTKLFFISCTVKNYDRSRCFTLASIKLNLAMLKVRFQAYALRDSLLDVAYTYYILYITCSGPTPFSSIRAPSITPTPSGPSRCVIYRLIKILGNKISPEDLGGRRSSSPKGAPLPGYSAFMGDQIHICEGPAHARVGANIVNKSRILYTPSETTRWKRGRQEEKEGGGSGRRPEVLRFGIRPPFDYKTRGERRRAIKLS